MRIKATRPAAALAALALTSGAVVGIAGAAQAAPVAHGVTAQVAAPADVSIEWGDSRAYAGGIVGVDDGTDWFAPITANIFPADAAGTVHFEATTWEGEVFDLGAQPVVDGTATAPTWVLPADKVENGNPVSTLYVVTAEFVPDDPADYSSATPTRDSFTLFQLPSDPRQS